MTNRTANLVFAALLGLFAYLHLHRLGAISPTWDEGGDASIVDCIQKTRDPFACLADISQTRLPFYIHALAGPAYGDERPHYLVSFAFSLATFVLTYWFARRRFGLGVATLTAALLVTSPQWLASGRMLLTHSNVIFAFFTTASFVAVSEHVLASRRERGLRHPERGGWSGVSEGPQVTKNRSSCRALRILSFFAPAHPHTSLRMTATTSLILCAVASGLAAASHPLAVFNGIAILAIYLAGRRYAWRDLWFFPIAAATFFAASVIYLKPANFRALVIACTLGEIYPFWNYFDTGANVAPWWFPFVILVVKVGPWWLLIGAICVGQTLLSVHPRGQTGVPVLQAFAVAFLLDLVLKGAVFHYETPHHQVQFYPFVYLAIATLIVRAWRPWIAVLVAAAFVVQAWDVVRFFPNYLFYGSQYGERFIGEFYGPAVMHAQDKDAVIREVDRILAAEPRARILVADHNALEHGDPRLVPFSKRDPQARYEYAFVDRLYARHFRFPERDAFNAYVAASYEPFYTYEFPPHVWMYRLLKLR